MLYVQIDLWLEQKVVYMYHVRLSVDTLSFSKIQNGRFGYCAIFQMSKYSAQFE